MYAGAREKTQRRVEPLAEALEGEGVVPAIVGIVEEQSPGVGSPLVGRAGNRLDGRVGGRQVAAGARVPGSGRDVLVAMKGRGLPDRIDAAEPALDEPRWIAVRADHPQPPVLADIARH